MISTKKVKITVKLLIFIAYAHTTGMHAWQNFVHVPYGANFVISQDHQVSKSVRQAFNPTYGNIFLNLKNDLKNDLRCVTATFSQ